MTSASIGNNCPVPLPTALKQQWQEQFDRQYKLGKRISWSIFEQDWSRELSSCPPSPPSVRSAVYLKEIYSKARDNCEYRIADGLCLLLLKISYQDWITQYRLSQKSLACSRDRGNAEPIKIAIAHCPQAETEQTDYIPRPTLEQICYNTLTQPGSLLRIKAPQAMGKTALMTQVLAQLKKQGYSTVRLSLKLVDQQQFNNLDSFLRWVCVTVSQELGLSRDFNNTWLGDILGSKLCCNNYFEQWVLPLLDSPLILCFDDIDFIFPHPTISNDFFPLLRFWHEQARSSSLWKKLRLVVIYSTDVYIPLNIHQSPFNVGVPMEIPEFCLEQVMNLATQHNLNWTQTEAHQLMKLVGGHPALVCLAISHLKNNPEITLDEILNLAPTHSGIYKNHLTQLLFTLTAKPALQTAFKQLLNSPKPVQLDPVIHHQLHSLGLVKPVGNKVQIASYLYQLYFQQNLTEEK